MSLIMQGGESFNCELYVSGFFDTNTGILCHCDDSDITENNYLSKGVYTRESHENILQTRN